MLFPCSQDGWWYFGCDTAPHRLIRHLRVIRILEIVLKQTMHIAYPCSSHAPRPAPIGDWPLVGERYSGQRSWCTARWLCCRRRRWAGWSSDPGGPPSRETRAFPPPLRWLCDWGRTSRSRRAPVEPPLGNWVWIAAGSADCSNSRRRPWSGSWISGWPGPCGSTVRHPGTAGRHRGRWKETPSRRCRETNLNEINVL